MPVSMAPNLPIPVTITLPFVLTIPVINSENLCKCDGISGPDRSENEVNHQDPATKMQNP